MKALVLYDSAFGNTAQIAQAVGDALGSQAEVTVCRVGSVQVEQLQGLHLLVVGSPTQGFRPTQAITNFLKGIPVDSLKGVHVAAFDTRISTRDLKSPIFRLIVDWGGYAAKRIAELLKKCGGELAVAPEGFYVEGKEGPLKKGELDRATAWAKHLLSAEMCNKERAQAI